MTLLLIVLPCNAQSNRPAPVLVSDYSIDTSLYDLQVSNFQVNRLIRGPATINFSPEYVPVAAYRRKNSDCFDIYSFEGKCGTSRIPLVNDSSYSYWIFFSCTMIDEDTGWESMVNIYEFYEASFKIYDEDGVEILSDSGHAYYGFDGNNTYVLNPNPVPIKTWRFRTNIVSSSSSLAKSKNISNSQMQVFGNFLKASLSPAKDGSIGLEIYDLSGNLLSSKLITDISESVTFPIYGGR